MRVVFRIGLVFLQFVVFVVIAAVSAKAYSYLTAKTYLPSDAPSRQFPIVAVRPRDPGSQVTQYQLVRWSEIETTRSRYPQLTFNLPQPEGRFVLPKRGGFEPQVAFKVLETTSNSQLVEVVWYDDDYERFGRYVADSTSLRPVYFREWGAGAMFVGIIPGLIGAWFMGWGVHRRWLKDPDVPNHGAA